jgi:hypothetical protein
MIAVAVGDAVAVTVAGVVAVGDSVAVAGVVAVRGAVFRCSSRQSVAVAVAKTVAVRTPTATTPIVEQLRPATTLSLNN